MIDLAPLCRWLDDLHTLYLCLGERAWRRYLATLWRAWRLGRYEARTATTPPESAGKNGVVSRRQTQQPRAPRAAERTDALGAPRGKRMLSYDDFLTLRDEKDSGLQRMRRWP